MAFFETHSPDRIFISQKHTDHAHKIMGLHHPGDQNMDQITTFSKIFVSPPTRP